MNETKWTPGPWEVADDTPYSLWVRCPDGKNPIHSSRLNRDQLYNAHLIAAAPDFAEGAAEFELYEQAVAREDDVAAMQHYAKAAATLRNALAKARGEQP